MRTDTQATREALLSAVGTLVRDRGPGFSLAELANRTGVSTATAYRHFASAPAAVDAFLQRFVANFTQSAARTSGSLRGLARLGAVCQAWVAEASAAGPALVPLRSPLGFIERARQQDPVIAPIYDLIAQVMVQCLDADEISARPIEFAVLLWNLLFDPRDILDLGQQLAWSEDQIAANLLTALHGALGASTQKKPRLHAKSAGLQSPRA